jgi:hypothetical protein
MNRDKQTMFTPKKIAAAVALALSATPVWATPIVADGKLDSTDGSTYQLGYSIGFLDDKGNSIGDGRLYFGINGGDNTQFLYFQLPVSYVDNTYGTNAAADWGKKGHTFNDLLGSDRWGVYDKKSGTGGFGWSGNSLTIDYLAGVCADTNNDSKCDKSAAVTSYRSGGVGTALTDGAIDNNDGAINSGSVAAILEIATSLEYDLLFVDPTATTNSSTDPNWINEVGYEIQFAAGTFDPADWLDPDVAFSLLDLGVVHASPSKTNYSSYDTPTCILGCTPSNDVPEPESLLLLGGGLAALGWARRRKPPNRGGAG